jgi:membrane-bound lytic murein transglycosylase D
VAIEYTVKSGDNLGYISSWYGVTVGSIKDWNGMESNSLRAGQKLTVYVSKEKAEDYRGINSLSFSEKQARAVKVTEPSRPVDQIAQAIPDAARDQFVLYTVRSGDNLWTIAQKYPGISHEDIMKLNRMTGSKLQTGQVLKIKRKEG